MCNFNTSIKIVSYIIGFEYSPKAILINDMLQSGKARGQYAFCRPFRCAESYSNRSLCSNDSTFVLGKLNKGKELTNYKIQNGKFIPKNGFDHLSCKVGFFFIKILRTFTERPKNTLSTIIAHAKIRHMNIVNLKNFEA